MATSCCCTSSRLLSAPETSSAACAVRSELNSCASALLTWLSSGETFVDQPHRLLPYLDAGQRRKLTGRGQHDAHFHAQLLPQQRAELGRQLRIIQRAVGFHMHRQIVATAVVAAGHADELAGEGAV